MLKSGIQHSKSFFFELVFLHPVQTTLLACLHQTFPPVAPDTDTCCSMLLSNTGASLMTFSVDQAACPSVLIKPHSGHIIPGGHQIFFLSTHPVNTVSQQHVLPLQLNSCPGYTKVGRGNLKMVGKVCFVVVFHFYSDCTVTPVITHNG